MEKHQPYMRFHFIYDIPVSWAFILIAGFYTLYAWGGLLLARKTLHKTLVYSHDRNEQVSFYMSAIGVFYGITLGLVAVGTWENFDKVNERVTHEAATLMALYRDVSEFPEPKKQELQSHLEEYTRYTVNEAWDMQRKGIMPTDGIGKLRHFQQALYAFHPSNKREELIMTETLRIYNEFVTMRRMRLMSVGDGLPSTIWLVTIIGALISISFFWFMKMESYRVQMFLTCVVAFFIGSMIFLIAMLDHPFRGTVSVGPEAFQILYEHMNK